MNSNSFLDPLETLRTTLAEIDSEPGPLTPELVLIRELLDNRLRRLEAESQRIAATKLDDRTIEQKPRLS